MNKSWAPLIVAVLVTAGVGPARADYQGGPIKIGVLNDQSGLYSDIAGLGSVWAAKKAVEDYGAAAKGMKVEIIAADHLNKPDIGSNIARQWFDVDKVDAIADVPTSSVALAVNEITREKNKVFLAVGPATSDLTTGPTTPGRWPTARAMRSSNREAIPGSSSRPIMPSATRWNATRRRS